jgi:hypothetical protein
MGRGGAKTTIEVQDMFQTFVAPDDRWAFDLLA